MMTHPLYIVDVFAEARLTGNPLGVVLNAQTLSAERMQAVARDGSSRPRRSCRLPGIRRWEPPGCCMTDSTS